MDRAEQLGADADDDVLRVTSLYDRRWSNGITAIGVDGSYVESRVVNEVDSDVEAVHFLHDGATRVRLRSPAHPKRTAWTTATIGRRWVVWMENTARDLAADDWRMFAYERNSGRVLHLADAPLVGGEIAPAPPGWSGAAISGDHVFWAQVRGAWAKPQVDLFGCRIESCVPRRIARNASFPSTTETGVFVLARAAAGRAPRILKFDPETYQRVLSRPIELDRDQQVTGLAANDEYAVWTSGDGRRHRAGVLDLDSGRRWDFGIGGSGQFGYPVAGDGFLAWGETSGSGEYSVAGFVFDPAKEQLRSIGDTSGLYDIKAAGDLLMWQEGSENPPATIERVVRVD